jgi:hypothetical protein
MREPRLELKQRFWTMRYLFYIDAGQREREAGREHPEIQVTLEIPLLLTLDCLPLNSS